MEKKKLTYSIIIATFKRLKILQESLQRISIQTLAPREIIIVDAGPNQYEIEKIMKQNNPDIKWIYIKADARSATVQRNQGLKIASSDIIIFLDDDTLMHPTCAEEIIRIYESDTKKIFMV